MQKLLLLLALALPFQAFASTFDDRARAASDAAYDKKREALEAFTARNTLGQLQKLRRFIASHRGAADLVMCVSPMKSCTENMSICIPGESGYQPMEYFAAYPTLGLSGCNFTLNDGLACQINPYKRAIECYDAQNRFRSFRF